jgi:apolipoprotein N-acyltransferase
VRPTVAGLLAVAAGLLLDLAFPGVGWWPVAPVAVAVLILTLHGHRVWVGALLGFAFGLGFFVTHVAWSGIYVGPMPWLALATLEALYFAVFGGVTALYLRAPGPAWLRPFVVALLWVTQEALRSRTPFGGFPWGRLAFSQVDSPALGLAAVGGAPLVSFVVALAGGFLAFGALAVLQSSPGQRARARSVRAATVSVFVAVGVLLVGGVVPRPSTGDRNIVVAGVQGNVPRAGLDFNAERRAVLDNHANATKTLAAEVAAGRKPRPDVVVWPENASDIDPLRNADAADVINDAVTEIGVPVLLGTVLREPVGKLSNASIVWEPGTGPGQRYIKRRPVPFAEYIPYRSFFRRISDKVDLVRTDFAAGNESNVVRIGPATVGAAICFEVAFDDLLREAVKGGANLLVVQTNNATFGRTDESVQQLAMSRLRAVEHGRAVVHISTVGVSALIAADGSMTQVSGHFTSETLLDNVPLRDDLTIATRMGVWPEVIMVVFGLLGASAGAVSGRVRRRAAPPQVTATMAVT